VIAMTSKIEQAQRVMERINRSSENELHRMMVTHLG
jgi:hypothetical protein